MALDQSMFSVEAFGELAAQVSLEVTKQLEEYTETIFTSGLVKRRKHEKSDFTTFFSEALTTSQYASMTGEGEDSKQGRIQPGYTKQCNLKKFTDSITITKEAMIGMRNEFNVTKTAQTISKVIERTRALYAQHMYTFGTVSSYVDHDGNTIDNTCADGLPLVHAAHTVRGSGQTYSTVTTGNPVLSTTSLALIMKEHIANSIDNLGNQVDIPLDILFTTNNPADVFNARVILGSTASTESNKNSNVINEYQGMFKHVILPKLDSTANGAKDPTKARYYGLASSEYVDMYTVDHAAWTSDSKYEYNERNSTMTWFVSGIFGQCIVSPRGIRLVTPSA